MSGQHLPSTGAQLQSRAIGGAITTALTVFISVPISLLTNAIVARLLRPEGFGQLALYTTSFTLAVGISEFGVPFALTQWSARAYAQGKREEVNRLLSESLGFRLAIQLPILLIVGWIILRGQPVWMWLGYSVLMTVSAAASGGAMGLLSQNRSALLARISLASSTAAQLALVLAALELRHAAGAWFARLAVMTFVFALGLIFLDADMRRSALWPRSPLRSDWQFWRFASSMWAAGLMTNLIYSRTEIFALQFYGRIADLGVFAVAFGLSQQLTGLVDAAMGPLLPATAALLGAQPHLARAALARALRVAAVGSGALFAGLAPGVFLVIPVVFGRRFGGAQAVFLLLAAVSTLQTAVQPFNSFLLARRRNRLILVAAAVGLTADIALAFTLVPFIGLWGAAVANAAGQVVSSMLFARAGMMSEGMTLGEIVLIMRPWAIGALVSTLSIFICTRIGPAVAAAMVAGIAGSALYAVLIRVTGGALMPADVTALESALPARLRSPFRWVATRTVQMDI